MGKKPSWLKPLEEIYKIYKIYIKSYVVFSTSIVFFKQRHINHPIWEWFIDFIALIEMVIGL